MSAAERLAARRARRAEERGLLAVADAIKAPKPRHRWQADAIRAKPTFRRTKAGWLVQGNRDMLTDAMENHDGWVSCSRRDDEDVRIQIEYVTAGDAHGLAFGWPVGTRGQTATVTTLPPTSAVAEPPQRRTHATKQKRGARSRRR